MAYKSDIVIEGKGQWLFLKGGKNSSLARQTGGLRFSDADLDRWTDALLSRHRWCGEHDAVYRHLFAPDKESVYRDKLPDEVAARFAPDEERLAPTLCSRFTEAQPGLVAYPRAELHTLGR